MARQVDNDTKKCSAYEKSMERYLENFDVLDDDEELVFIGAPGVPVDDIAGGNAPNKG